MPSESTTSGKCQDHNTARLFVLCRFQFELRYQLGIVIQFPTGAEDVSLIKKVYVAHRTAW